MLKLLDEHGIIPNNRLVKIVNVKNVKEKKSEKNIKELTFGVTFNNKFKLLDSWGEIADDILYKNKKYFSAEFFNNITAQYTTERRLFNSDLGHSLVLTANNLVFTQKIENNYDEEYALFKKRVTDYLIPSILTKYVLVVRRIGIVYVEELNDEGIKKFSSQYFLPSVQNVMDFRFSKKETTVKGRLLAENSDFINKIFTVGNIGENFQGISYDYQRHFSPLREDIRNMIANFLSEADQDFSNDILSSLGE